MFDTVIVGTRREAYRTKTVVNTRCMTVEQQLDSCQSQSSGPNGIMGTKLTGSRKNGCVECV